MATNLNYSVGVSTAQGVQALQNLQNKLGQTNSAFSGLKSAVAGFATAGFIASLYQSAAALKDVSDASNIGVQQLLGFQKAVQQFGGDAQGALDGVSKLAQAIDGAASGSKTLQNRFADLGISLSDLATLTEGEILNKVVKNLGEGENGAAKMAAAIDLFGKNFKNVNFKDVAANIDAYTEAQKKAAAATESADKAEEAFGNTMTTFKGQLLQSLQPITELATAILNFVNSSKAIIKWAFDFGVALASLWAIGKGVKILIAGLSAIPAVFAYIAETASGVAGLFRVMFNPILRADLTKNVGLLGGALQALKPITEVIFGSMKAVATAIGLVTSAIYASWDAITKLLGISSEQAKKTDDQTQKEKDRAKVLREVTDAYAQQRAAIRQTSVDFQRSNSDTLDAINLSNGLIGITKENQDVMKAQEAIYKKAADENLKLRDSIAKLTAEEKRAGLGTEMDKQIAKIVEIAAADAARVKQAVENTNRIEALQQLKTFSLTNELELQKQLQGVQDDMAKMTMSEIEKKYYDIDAAAKASAKSAIDAEQARRGGAALNTAEIKAYYDEATKGSAKLKAAAEEQYNSSRSFSTGWKQAFNEYVENANNAANRAKDIFQKATQGMEDLIVNFAKTGKFEFKTFVASMVEDLLRSQLKQSMSSLFSLGGNTPGGGGGGNFFGNIASMLGFAAGGLVPNNKPILVGERGPEIISGMGGRTVTPNNQLGTTVNYNISAVDARSFKQMIAQDPSFLYAVTQQGARSIPGVR